MNKETTIPVGQAVLGRVLNSQGEPIDGKGPIPAAQRVQLYPLTSKVAEKAQPGQMLVTGIKPVDLLAPLTRGGTVAFYGGVGVGKLVLIEELIHNIVTQYDGYAVCMGMDESSYEVSQLMAPLKEVGRNDRVVMLFEQTSDSPEVCQRLAQAGLTIAGELRGASHEVLLVADENLTSKGKLIGMRGFRQMARAKGVPTLLLRSRDEYIQDEERNLDGRIDFSPELAKQDIWPALDPQLSSSHLLENGAVGEEHRRIAQQVKELLSPVHGLQGQTSLSSGEQAVVRMAQRIQYFLTQPFFIAEPYTERPGEFVSLEETLKGFAGLLEERYDDVADKALYFVGGIEQAKLRTI